MSLCVLQLTNMETELGVREGCGGGACEVERGEGREAGREGAGRAATTAWLLPLPAEGEPDDGVGRASPEAPRSPRESRHGCPKACMALEGADPCSAQLWVEADQGDPARQERVGGAVFVAAAPGGRPWAHQRIGSVRQDAV